jgi:hypothetical protein
MFFPFEIKYKFKVDHEIDKNHDLIKFIEDEFRRLKVDEFTSSPSRTIFKTHLFNKHGRNHIFLPIDGGYIQCTNNLMTISFSTMRMALITLLVATIFWVVSASDSFAAFAFLWLYLANVIVFLFRSRLLVKRLKKEIEELHLN